MGCFVIILSTAFCICFRRVKWFARVKMEHFISAKSDTTWKQGHIFHLYTSQRRMASESRPRSSKWKVSSEFLLFRLVLFYMRRLFWDVIMHQLGGNWVSTVIPPEFTCEIHIPSWIVERIHLLKTLFYICARLLILGLILQLFSCFWYMMTIIVFRQDNVLHWKDRRWETISLVHKRREE